MLVRRAARGDDRAFDILAERHAPALLRLATHRLGGDRVVGEEVVQDALVRLHRALPRFRGMSSLRTWLVRITLNLCADEARRRRRAARHVAIEEADRHGPVLEPGESVADDVARVRAVIARLPDGLKTVIELRYDAGLSYLEISEVVGCPLGTVGTRLTTALREIRREIALENSK
jgi:RNA polymerase sigma-70 factor (ECF subfamily)